MKSTFLPLLVFLPFLALAQESKPPAVVQQTMMAKYQGAKKVHWEKEGDNMWEAEFVWEDTHYEVTYDNAGNRVETERQLKESEIPEKFITALSKEYPGYKIDEAWWKETEKGIFYEFELKGANGEVEVLMNSNCDFVADNEDSDSDDGEVSGDED